jgi:peptidase C10 family protein
MKNSNPRMLPWYIVASCTVILSFACCTVDSDAVMEVQCEGADEIAVTDGSIAVGDALGALNRTLTMIDGQTRSRTRVAQRISALTKRQMFGTSSRAGLVPGEDDDNLVYVVNFADNRGYAILNAVSNSPDTVLVIGDNGNFNPDRLLAGVSRTADDIDDGDLYEPTPDSLKIMFADLYCEEDDDFYIGNNGGCGEGFDVQIIKKGFVGNGPGGGFIGGDSGGGTVEYTDDGFLKSTFVDKLLKTKWDQDAPFNNEIHFAPDGSGRRPAGCTTIAAAQILANIKTISPTKIAPEVESTWESLESVKSGDNSHIADSLAIIIKAMADGIKVKYNWGGYDGTFATPKKVRKYLESIGCKVSQYYSLSDRVESKIYASISSGKPVFIGALDHDAIKRGGHAWVFDGYGKRPSDKHCFLHCNYGWAGKSNGWYYYKLFKKSDDKNKRFLDEGVEDRKGYFNYSWCYRVLIIK